MTKVKIFHQGKEFSFCPLCGAKTEICELKEKNTSLVFNIKAIDPLSQKEEIRKTIEELFAEGKI